MKTLLMTGTLALIATGAHAAANDHTGFYLGANLGQAQYDISHEDLDDIAILAFEEAGATVIDGESTFDDKGTPFNFTVGYRFNRYLALEAGYLDLGEAQYRSEGTVIPPGPPTLADATMDLDVSAKGPTLAVVAFAPIGDKFDVHARGGVFFADVTLDIAATIDDTAASDDFSASSEDFFIGVGATYSFTDNLAITADFVSYLDVGDEEETGEGTVNALTAGFIYRF